MSVILKIKNNTDFSKAEKQIAKYILEKPKDVISVSIHHLAEEIGVSPASIIRFCKKMGTKGFYDFKILLSSDMSIFEHNEMESSPGLIAPNIGSTSDVIKFVCENNIASIRETLMLLDENDLDEAVNLINKHERIDFYGIGASYLVASDGHLKFLRSGKRTFLSAHSDQRFLQAKNSTKDDLAIICSYSGRTKEIIEIAKTLEEQNTPIISITGYDDNPIARLSNINLKVSSNENHYRIAAMSSTTGMLNVMHIIFSLFISKYDEQIIENIATNYIDKVGE